jgi:hypothetical protein
VTRVGEGGEANLDKLSTTLMGVGEPGCENNFDRFFWCLTVRSDEGAQNPSGWWHARFWESIHLLASHLPVPSLLLLLLLLLLPLCHARLDGAEPVSGPDKALRSATKYASSIWSLTPLPLTRPCSSDTSASTSSDNSPMMCVCVWCVCVWCVCVCVYT